MKEKKINKERFLWIIISSILTGILLFIILNDNIVKSDSTKNEDEYKRYTKLLEESANYIKENYVGKDIKSDYKSLYYGALRGLLDSTNNKWNKFYDEEEWKELWDRLEGNLVGIGVYIKEDKYRKGVPVIVEPIKGSPAEQKGLIPLDRIIKINGIETEGKNFDDNIDRITGKEGTQVKLTVERTLNNVFEVVITRQVIKVVTVEKEMINSNIGYIKLRRFSSDTDKELVSAMEELTNEGMNKLIIDLRNNPGGLLSVCIRICDRFISSGIICTTKGRSESDNRKFKAEGETTIFPDKPLVLLVNENSASASEIFSGAMKDHKRALLVGTQTYGKGMVASIMPIYSTNQGIGVSIIIQKYYTPNGTDINEIGITPNIIIKPLEYTADDLFYLKKLQYEGEVDLIHKFVDENKNFTEEDIINFHKKLLDEGYSISYYALKNEVINERDRYKRKLFDTENDIQLREAIEIISSEE